jgi:hypothetical protein
MEALSAFLKRRISQGHLTSFNLLEVQLYTCPAALFLEKCTEVLK